MQLNNQLETYKIISSDLVFEMLPSGDVYQIKYQNENISMYHANTLEGMLMNIYLRVNGRHYTKLLGVSSPSGFRIGKNQMQYFGEFENVRYQVDFKLINLTWFWLIKLNSEDPNLVVEVFYGQDVSLNNGAVNEAYTCQYLDHQVQKDEIGYHLQTKQNQGLKLLLQQGALTETCAYATDGFDFFGKEYKLNNQIKFLKEGSLPSRIYQYEFAYISLQTPKIQLDEPQEIGFYACLTPDYQETKCRWQTRAEIKSQYLLIIDEEDFQEFPKIHLAISGENTYPYLPFSEAELEEFFPKKVFQEEADNLLLSWFTETGTHFVTGAKEAYLERAQGNIIANNGMREIEKPAICSTNYIFGVFNSQICLGNTQFHKMISRNQTPLNILKFSGQRIFLKYQGIYRLLTIPAVYEMNINSSAWYYKVDDDILKIEVGIPVEDNLVRLEFSSKQRRSYDLILCQELVMGEFVGRHPLQLKVDGEFVEFYFDETTMAHHYYPDYYFKSKIETEGSYQYVGDEIFYEDGKGRGNPLFGLLLKGSKFSYTIYGVGGQKTFPSLSIEEIKKEYQKVHQNNCNNFKLEIDSDNPTYLEIQKFNLLVPWYVHNALIHYSMPHGLEQYSGGAWGTRDICQGPAELFMAFGRYDLLKSIILKVYERQFHESGDWPQWFMFDNYGYIQADSSHGDIIVWPLYLLSKYLLETADKEILKIKVPYTTKAGLKTKPETIYQHLVKQIDSIKTNFISGTNLSSYGGGDWDDTLQPVKDESRTTMASSWTVALTIEALKNLLFTIDEKEIRSILKNMISDYHKYFIKDGVPAGFVEFKDDGVKHLVHPSDEVTKIKYRLLTFNRSLISETVSKEKVSDYLDIIDENLMHPDGVRLMDTTVKYCGGNPKIFMRAETATNFGREIGLQYVHAHIRYLEAMGKIGDSDRLFKGLKVINPILIKENVANALTRQSNVYFSSSDGDFINRYDADKNFDKLRNGKVAVKGGWRLYSSGPGIYLHQLVSTFLGISNIENELYLDPVIPKTCDGLKLNFRYKNFNLRITYEIKDTKGIEYVIVNGTKIEANTNLLKYRRSGIIIPISYLEEETEIIVRM